MGEANIQEGLGTQSVILTSNVYGPSQSPSSIPKYREQRRDPRRVNQYFIWLKKLDPGEVGLTMRLRMEPKVLFIDDDADWREAASLALEGAGYSVVTAKDASEAMERGEACKVGMIVLDLNLDGESGLTLMKYLRHNYPGVPILLFTGLEHDDSTVRAMLDEGADQYMRKAGVEELLVTVGTYLRPN